MEFLYEATMATILIGPDQKNKTRVVKLEDVSPMLFRMFVSWLYDGKSVYTASDELRRATNEDRLDTKGLRIQAIDTMAELLLQRRKRLCFTAYSYIYANTTAKSPLRKLAVHVLAYHTRHNLAEQAFWMHLPHELAITTLLMNSTMLKDSSPRKDKDLMPFGDMCLYHEHADEEEKKACRARRSKTIVK
ncbi:hypothetical protein KCU83_g9182, partial [Aureobasidium melanogenum]